MTAVALTTPDTETESRRESNDGSLLPVFVYGSLRVGEDNYEWAKTAVVRNIRNCRTNGKLYHVSENLRLYPVAKLDQPGTIRGDLLFFEEHNPITNRVIRMETTSGYVMRRTAIFLPDGSDLMGYAFHYKNDPRGQLIPSGNWFAPDSYLYT